MALLIDIDNTLLDSIGAYKYSMNMMKSDFERLRFGTKGEFSKLYEESRKEVKQQLHLNPSNRLRILYFKKLCVKKYGSVNPSWIFLQEKLYFRYFREALREFYRENRKSYNRTFQLLNEISKKTPLVLLSNENIRTQLFKLSQFIQVKFPYDLVTSEEVGAEKPDLSVFRYALQLSGDEAEESWMIGDSWQDDILGASELSIRCIQQKRIFGRAHSPKVRMEDGISYWESSNLISSLEWILENL